MDKKTIQIIKETLTGTKSTVKFMGEISREFEIKTGVRQGDVLSPVLFNCVLEKILGMYGIHPQALRMTLGLAQRRRK